MLIEIGLKAFYNALKLKLPKKRQSIDVPSRDFTNQTLQKLSCDCRELESQAPLDQQYRVIINYTKANLRYQGFVYFQSLLINYLIKATHD
jgi:hypothetical protein